MWTIVRIASLFILFCYAFSCNPCYSEAWNGQCAADVNGKQAYTLHMSIHPHLDAFWIFNFESYYNPKPTQSQVRGYFMQNRFSSVKDIFTTAKDILWQSKNLREKDNNATQKAHRTFFNSEMGFFKRWFVEQNEQDKAKVREILKTKYWEILGGGIVEHDQGCAYYDDIIENYQMGLKFLRDEFNYQPKIAVSADSFGHSQTSLAILAHIGVEGYFVERSDEHILLQNKTEFIWKARSANGRMYGALPTHIRWAIHGFEDQFIGGNINENMCQSKEGYMSNLRRQNQFLKRVLKSNHIMRYFGHDFQKFDNYSYTVIESMMQKFSREKCNRVVAKYGNPTEYFITLMREVFSGVKPVATRSEDIFPIWDYDSGLYWTGYFTTDAYHKKSYRDVGRFLHGVRKIWLSTYLDEPKSAKNIQNYQKMEQLAEQVAYLQHHDGISGTSKYKVMDELEKKNDELLKAITKGVLTDVFTNEFPEGTSNVILECHMGVDCIIPPNNNGDVYLKIINTDSSTDAGPIIAVVPFLQYYAPDCQHQINCFCQESNCPCKIYMYQNLTTYTAVRLQKINSFRGRVVNSLNVFTPNGQQYNFNRTHFKINLNSKSYSLGYKKVKGQVTNRNYNHLTRYGTQTPRSFSIKPGKYALGNNPNQIQDFSEIDRVYFMRSLRYTFFVIKWKRQLMKTLISIPNAKKNQWKVETIAAAEAYYLQDLYFEVESTIDNKNRFVTDSNGWLTVNRELFKHQDYKAFFSQQKYDDINGNTYPATAFAYIQDNDDKISINLDRPQGVIAYRPGTLWVNFERLSVDDGKWVYQSAYRNQYQRFVHIVTVQNNNNNERKIQRRYDQPVFISGSIVTGAKIDGGSMSLQKRSQWGRVSKLNNLKFWIRPFNDTTTIVRVKNMQDNSDATVGLFATNISPLLTTYYGRTVTFETVTEQSLGGNIPYSEFVERKWNWNSIVNLTEQNKIFNKIFKENITLAPLEIRTFLFVRLDFADKCIEPRQLQYNKQQINYQLDPNKTPPSRDASSVSIQNNLIHFMQNGDRCNGQSVVLAQNNMTVAADNPLPQTIASIKIQYDRPGNINFFDSFSSSPNGNVNQPSPPESQSTNILNKAQTHNPFVETPLSQLTKLPQSIEQRFKAIESKIETNQKLSQSQKLSYFSKKLELIRASIKQQ